MMRSLLWYGALMVIGLLTLGLQLDRQVQRTPALAERVPEPFRSSAQLPVAAYALAGDDAELALEEAERLIRRRPLPAEHLRILAQAQVAAGSFEEGTLSIQYAAQRGWRDPLAQESMLRLAIDAGDQAEAARRYAALFLRRDTQDALLEELGASVLQEPNGLGRQTLTTIVSGGSRWHNQFLNRGARVMPTDAFTEVIRETIGSGTDYDCEVLERVSQVVLNRDPEAGNQMRRITEAECGSSAP